MNLKFSTEEKDGYLLCSVKGEIDLYNARQLKDKVADVLEDVDDPKLLVLDIQDVKYIDSTGLGILIGIKRRITESGGKLVLVLSEQRILQLFNITGLTNVFPIANDREEAVRKIQE